MSSKGRLSTTLDESPRDVIDILPAVHRFYTRGEITLADYNRNWPIILCCEISKKIGLNLVYKQTMTMTEAGPARVVSVWFMSISYRYICGYQPVTPGLTEEENVREILGALYNRLSDVGALPSGIARLCARYELLRPVVLLTIPWFQHLMNKLDETLYKDLKFDLPTRPVNETTVRVKIDSLTQHMQKWSAHYWTSKLFMRCPSYVNMVRLWGAGVPNIRLPNDQFCYVYEASGIKGGKIQFAEDFLADNNDPQKQRKILQARLNNPPEAGPHALLLGIPPALTAYLDGLDETSPLNLGVDEYINFAQGGADKSKSKEQPMPTTLIGQSHFGRSLTHASAPKDDVLFVPVDKPSDFQITIHEEKPGVSMLIHNLPDDEKDPMIARQLEYTTTSEILAIVGIKDGEYDVIGRVKADGYSKFYKVRSLHVRLKPHVRKPDLQDLNHTLRRNPRLKTFAIGWYNEENEKYKRGFEKKNSNEAKRSSRENRRSRSRSSSRERYRKHERRRSRSPRKSKSPGSHRNSKGSSHKFSAADQDFKDLYARRVKNFVSGVAETADCQLIVNSVVEPQQIRSQVKFSGIPFMMLGATGLALEPKQAENLALVTLIGRLVDYGILPNVLVDLISTYDEWCEPVCKVIGPCVNFAKAILKSPDYANILMEIDSYERSGMQFLQATRADQIFGVTKFAQTMIEFGGRHWKTTLIIAPEKLPHLPNVSDGTVRIVAWDSKEARDERTKERAIKDKQERRRAAEEKQRKRDKKQKDSKKRSRSSSRGRNRDEKSMSIEYDDGSPMDIEKKPETTFVDLVSDSSIDSDEEDPAAALKRLAEKEEELERKNREIQKQLELVDKGLLEPEAALALLRSLSKDSKEKKARQREKDAGKKSLKDRSRSSSPKKSQRDGRVDGSNSVIAIYVWAASNLVIFIVSILNNRYSENKGLTHY